MQVPLSTCDPSRIRLLAEDRLPASEMGSLEDHLQNCPHCRASLDEWVDDDRWSGEVRQFLGSDQTEYLPAHPTTDESLDFLAPSDWPDSLGRLGTYEVKGVLGRGGMGVVLKAFDPSLNRNVAIKVLSASFASCGAARRRFLREARAAAAVVHEHVVSVFAVVETSGLPFLVMEYVPGRSLQERLEAQGPLALPEILRIGMQTAAGLAAAHAQGLVHRDVKPANILLENGVERVRLTDFGLARAAADAAMTQSGLVAGTPHYMAPEQARGERTDHRADLFSLGSMLYAMCTGNPPFRAESALAVLRRVTDDRPRAIREINPEIPDWLEAIIGKLHVKEAAGRFESAQAVADLLGRCLAHVQQPLAIPLPLDAFPKDSQPLIDKSRRRTWRWAAIAGVACIAAGAVSVAIGWSLVPHAWNRQLDHAGPSNAHVSSNAGFSRSGKDEINERLEETIGRARAMEADLYRATNIPATDRLSARALGLAERARKLEQDIVSGSHPISPPPISPVR
jgi:serine/threonine protein kinase